MNVHFRHVAGEVSQWRVKGGLRRESGVDAIRAYPFRGDAACDAYRQLRLWHSSLCFCVADGAPVFFCLSFDMSKFRARRRGL